MQSSRESIYNGLFLLLQKSQPTIKSFSRRARLWEDVPQIDDQPALYQFQGSEKPLHPVRQGLPYSWELLPELLIYTTAGEDPDAIPSMALNPILDALETTFPPNVQNGTQNLGLTGVVSARLHDVLINEGFLDGQSITHVIIRIVAT